MANKELIHLVDSKFFVCDGNHKQIAWMNHINHVYPKKHSWHITIDSIVLDTTNQIRVAMQKMHDINKWVLFFL